MEVSDRCLLRNQYTYPNSYQYLSTVPIRPFQVHSDELEKCVCETHSTGRICPYHEALKVAPPERSGAMKAVVESHDLAIEAGQLLLTTRAHTQHEDFDRLVRLRGAVEASEEGVVLGKAAVKLIKAALQHRGISMHIPLAPLVAALVARCSQDRRRALCSAVSPPRQGPKPGKSHTPTCRKEPQS